MKDKIISVESKTVPATEGFLGTGIGASPEYIETTVVTESGQVATGQDTGWRIFGSDPPSVAKATENAISKLK